MRKLTKTILIGCISFLVAFGFAGCKKDCDHVYDNACDATCNECGEIRGVGAHDYEDADCTTPKTCKTCGATEGNALGHQPEYDDGDCTTEVKCKACGEVTTPAKAEHIARADDGDCATPVTCAECATALTAAKSHDFTGDYVTDKTQHWRVCKNEGCNVTDEKENHKSGGAATETIPEKCTVCEYVISPELTHIHDHNTKKFDETNHWDECRCSDKKNVTPHSAISDNNCTTDDKCSCGYTVTAAKDHVAGEDDGDCTTPIKCVNCDKAAVAGNIDHTAGADDGDCTTAVKCTYCDVTVLEATDGHTPETDDHDCTTDSKCRTCGTVLEKGNDSHTPVADDGNCSTPQACVNCDQTVVASKEHTDADHDYLCDNPGCQVSVNPPKDTSSGIDLPIDRN